jgi:ATP-dependent Clp protease protease subunit
MKNWKRLLCVLAVAVLAMWPAPNQLSADTPDTDTDTDVATPVPEVEEEKSELDLMRDELQRLQTEAQLIQQRQKNELLELELAKQRIQAEDALRSAQQSDELAEMRAEVERIKAMMSLQSTHQEMELAEARAELNRLNTERQLEDAQRSAELERINAKSATLQADNNLMQQRLKRMQLESQLLQTEYTQLTTELQSRMSVREMKDKAHDRVLDDIDYRAEPLDGDTLYVSDRRIPLNGPIYSGAADYVTERIDFYNNQDHELPIFIVIDNCPGGSVMEGYRIVKAMQTSPAPVHVVVKSFAASMAAVITTLADHSYCYPNAIILHHQMSSGMSGNLTQQKEQLENGMEWARRLADPVAEKMGVTYDEFVELMYENNSNGDWEEFGDNAVKLKWVNTLVHEIREDGIRERPTGEQFAISIFFQAQQTDAEGNAYIQLPPLQPFDHYFLYNPTNFYRW